MDVVVIVAYVQLEKGEGQQVTVEFFKTKHIYFKYVYISLSRHKPIWLSMKRNSTFKLKCHFTVITQEVIPHPDKRLNLIGIGIEDNAAGLVIDLLSIRFSSPSFGIVC